MIMIMMKVIMIKMMIQESVPFQFGCAQLWSLVISLGVPFFLQSKLSSCNLYPNEVRWQSNWICLVDGKNFLNKIEMLMAVLGDLNKKTNLMIIILTIFNVHVHVHQVHYCALLRI